MRVRPRGLTENPTYDLIWVYTKALQIGKKERANERASDTQGAPRPFVGPHEPEDERQIVLRNKARNGVAVETGEWVGTDGA